MAGDPQLLEPGKSYFFITRTLERKGWHTLVPVYGNIEIRAPKNTDDEGVLSSQHARELRERFAAAVENQIPFDPKNP